MNTHYYFSDFDSKVGFPREISCLLYDNITNRKSIVFICTIPDNPKETDKYFEINKNWFHKANIIFDEYYIIDYRTQKRDAQLLVKNASVIFLCGGDTISQNKFLKEYELKSIIKNSKSIIIGISAGAINMAVNSICIKGKNTEEIEIYNGIGLEDISIKPHFSIDNTELLHKKLFPLSHEMKIYALCDNSAIIANSGKIQFVGDVYLISESKINKIGEMFSDS